MKHKVIIETFHYDHDIPVMTVFEYNIECRFVTECLSVIGDYCTILINEGYQIEQVLNSATDKTIR